MDLHIRGQFSFDQRDVSALQGLSARLEGPLSAPLAGTEKSATSFEEEFARISAPKGEALGPQGPQTALRGSALGPQGALGGAQGPQTVALGAAVNDGGLGTRRAGKRVSIDRESPLFEQCRELETFLMKTLLKEMRKTVPEGELGDNSFAGKMYQEMLDDEYAKSLACNGGFGLADLAYLELSGQRGKVSILV